MKKTPKMLFYIASSRFIGRFSPNPSAAFSTLSANVASKLKDPSLVESGSGDGCERFNVFDPGASSHQFEEGSAVIAQVKRMRREDARQVSSSCPYRCAMPDGVQTDTDILPNIFRVGN
jgi:hypothetical protein